MDAIIPAAGLASRMRGIPKFLLPADVNYQTLIEKHISSLQEIVDTIWIPIRSEFVLLLDSLRLSGDRIVLIPMTTRSMSESVGRILEISSAQKFMMVMPDTAFIGEQPYEELSTNEFAKLACWKIRDSQRGKLGQVEFSGDQITAIVDKDPTCSYSHAWGALSFDRKLSRYIDYDSPHIGYAVRNAVNNGEYVTGFKVEGDYFDCGTPSEYSDLVTSNFRT
jgi:NDP-sugar pyrophosphorylase family protein